MHGIPLQHWMIAATLLFSLGLYGVIARRNAIAVLMGVEIMFAAANINFLAFWRYLHLYHAPGSSAQISLEAPVFVTIIILVAACEAAVALAIVLSVFRRFRSIDVESVDLMQG